MAYLHIDNLYKNRDILMFRECYALEKIHGTSAHVRWAPGEGLAFFSGGEKHEKFVALFDEAGLSARFAELGLPDPVVVCGEAYGGKCQRMSKTYGPNLKFIAFEVRIGKHWLAVPDAAQVVRDLNLEFVPFAKVSTDIAVLDRWCDMPSVVAERRGMGSEQKREGIVLRPLIELRKNNDTRIIAKYKGDEFRETRTGRKVERDATKPRVMETTDEIAQEWVTEMRLAHVLDKLGQPFGIERTPEVIKAMIADVEREAAGEIAESKAARRAIGKRTAAMLKARLRASLGS